MRISQLLMSNISQSLLMLARQFIQLVGFLFPFMNAIFLCCLCIPQIQWYFMDI